MYDSARTDDRAIQQRIVSFAVFLVGFLYHRLLVLAIVLFLAEWILQFVGHIFEGKPPEFFRDWRFLFVGFRWWWAKINGFPHLLLRQDLKLMRLLAKTKITAKDLRVFPFSFTSGGFPALQKNRTEFLNFIYKPTAALLFAVEYRHLFTVPAKAAGQSADHLNLAAGVRF